MKKTHTTIKTTHEASDPNSKLKHRIILSEGQSLADYLERCPIKSSVESRASVDHPKNHLLFKASSSQMQHLRIELIFHPIKTVKSNAWVVVREVFLLWSHIKSNVSLAPQPSLFAQAILRLTKTSWKVSTLSQKTMLLPLFVMDMKIASTMNHKIKKRNRLHLSWKRIRNRW